MTEKHDDGAAELLIKEVDEDLRQEELQKLWKKHGGLMTVAVVGLVLAVAGWQGWQAWDGKQRRASSARYAEAAALVEQGKNAEAADALQALAGDGTKGYRVVADFRRADLLQQAGDVAGAAALYRRIAADSAVEQVYRDMASIRGAYLSLDADDPASLERAMESLAAEGSAWRHSAREVTALAALRRGDSAKASELFAKIAEDGAAPQGLRTRAAEMLAVVGPRAKS